PFGALGQVPFVWPCCRGSWSGLGFSAPFFGRAMLPWIPESSPPASRYWLLIRNSPAGPFDEPMVKEKLASGEISSGILACPEGNQVWSRLSDVLDIGPPPSDVVDIGSGPMCERLSDTNVDEWESIKEIANWHRFLLFAVLGICVTIGVADF